MTRLRIAGAAACGLLLFGVAFAYGFAQTHGLGGRSHPVQVAAPSDTSVSTDATAVTTAPNETTAPCNLSVGTGGPTPAVPVNQVCTTAGAPHFATPQAAMAYLAGAWNSGDVRRIDYVTDPNGRRQMDAMAAQMVNLQFKSCSPNPTGDYTCFFRHAIAPSTSATTYPNPAGYPPGEAVFTVAPAARPGWYLTYVIHCG